MCGGLVLIKGPDSLLEPVLMERGERSRTPRPGPDASTTLRCDVMRGAPDHRCLPLLTVGPKQWSDGYLGGGGEGQARGSKGKGGDELLV